MVEVVGSTENDLNSQPIIAGVRQGRKVKLYWWARGFTFPGGGARVSFQVGRREMDHEGCHLVARCGDSQRIMLSPEHNRGDGSCSGVTPDPFSSPSQLSRGEESAP